MKAYQMIYTACGKTKNGDYDVWGHSSALDYKECGEIDKIMSYQRPNGAPFQPTEEEIKQYFPKKYGYFYTSSGKACIAQSSHVGRVYSDVDERWGNYVTHALCFASDIDFSPFDIFGAPIFKDKLTYKEWHDDPSPESLPEIAVTIPKGRAVSGVPALLSDSRKKNMLPAFVQAVINTLETNDKAVVVSLSDEEIPTLLALVGVALPKFMHKKVTFQTQYRATGNYGDTTVRARVQFPLNRSTYGFVDDMRAGKTVFNFDTGDFTDVKVGGYVKGVFAALNGGIDAAERYAASIGKAMTELHCDIEAAALVGALMGGKYNDFDSPAHYESVLNMLIGAKYVNKEEYASRVYSEIVAKAIWPFNTELSGLIRFAYENGGQSIRNELVFRVMKSLSAFGITLASPTEQAFDSFKRGLPIDYKGVVSAALTDQRWTALTESADEALTYVILRIYIDALKTPSAATAENYILRIAKKAYEKGGLDALVTNLSLLGDNKQLADRLIYSTVGALFGKGSLSEKELSLAFDGALLLSTRGARRDATLAIIKGSLNSPALISVYTGKKAANPQAFAEIERELSGEAEFVEFVKRCRLLEFKNKQTVTPAELDRYFKEYYITGEDDGTYLKKLDALIGAKRQVGDAVEALLDVYTKNCPADDSSALCLDVVSYIEKKIFSYPLSELIRLRASVINQVAQIDARLKGARRQTSGQYELLYTAMLITRKTPREVLYTAVEGKKIYERLSPEKLELFARSFTTEAVALYVDMKRKDKKLGKQQLMTAIIHPLLSKVKDSNLYFTKAIKAQRFEDGAELVADLMCYAFNTEGGFADRAREFVKYYVSTLKRPEYKKLFKLIKVILTPKEYAGPKKFINDYLNNNRSFLEKLFGAKKAGEDEDDEDDEDEDEKESDSEKNKPAENKKDERRPDGKQSAERRPDGKTPERPDPRKNENRRPDTRNWEDRPTDSSKHNEKNRKCQRCGNYYYSEKFSACPRCGEVARRPEGEKENGHRCTECGAPYTEKDRFCSSCGKPVGKKSVDWKKNNGIDEDDNG